MKKRFNKVGFNTKLIIDVMLASVIVQKAPAVVDMIFPLDDSLKTVAGVGVGYLVGSLTKKPDLANASIALGVVDMLTPMLDGLLGGTGGTPITPASSSVMVPVKSAATTKALENFITLNDYTNNPSARLSFTDYSRSYSY